MLPRNCQPRFCEPRSCPSLITLVFLLVPIAGCVGAVEHRPTQAEAAAGPPPSGGRPSAASLLVGAREAPEAAAPAQTADRVWAPGYWHYDGIDYVWVPGRWQPRRVGYSWYGSR